MIPFIIGGVALAATGYGLAKYFEDDCECFESNHKSEEPKKSTKKEQEYPTKPFFVDLGGGDGYSEPQDDESLGKFDIAKIQLYNTSLLELTTALREIENLPESIRLVDRIDFAQTIYPFERVSEELKSDFEKHAQILQDTKAYINTHLDTLDAIIISDTNYENYSDEDKKLILNLIAIFQLIDHAIYATVTNDRVSISRDVKRAFGKMEQLILNETKVEQC